ncbi:MAG: radical SAM protein, partial [Actinomycetota bacterium]|nr:radical SAM protein [Actinomycetota bacterium]
MPRYWLETLGCPKNQVDSEKLVGRMELQGHSPAASPDRADLIVVNTCAFIEAAREESVGVVLDMARHRRPGAKLVVTGCMAERYGEELAEALDEEVDMVAPFGVDPSLALGEPVTLRRGSAGKRPSFDLLELPRPPASAPWAYVKVAEGCDRACGFCAIPSFRGRQRSRTLDAVLREVDELGAKEIVLVAQDLASWGRDLRTGPTGPRIGDLVEAVARRAQRVRLLYLYPSSVNQELVDVICGTGVPYFDLSLQHASRSLLRRMRRWGDGRS